MAQLLEFATRIVVESQSPLAFSTTGSDSWPRWDRYLTVNGKQAYHLGNICGTCAFLFEKMEGAAARLGVGELATRLAEGLESLDEESVDKLVQLMPAGNYIVALLRLRPEAVQLNGSNDYFAVEQVENVGVDPFTGRPHDPKTPYYRIQGRSRVTLVSEPGLPEAFDFIVPMFPEASLEQDRVAFYEKSLKKGHQPTAVTLSVLDVKGPADGGVDHWCLAHYLVDGHHKVAAAAHAQQEMTLIAFVAVDHGIASEAQVRAIIQTIPPIA
ncbi:hypothetical protein [Brevundimonas naejangsanensis]